MNKKTLIAVHIAIAILSIPLVQITDIVTSQAVSGYYIPALAGYPASLAVFMRDGVLYAVYDNGVDGTTVIRLDTGEVAKTCSFSDYDIIDYIVGGNGTAYAALEYWSEEDETVGMRIIDVMSCDIIAEFPKSDLLGVLSGYCVQGLNCYMRYDMYNAKLMVVYIYDNTWNRLSLVDPATKTIIKTVDLGEYLNQNVYGAYVGPHYYYINLDGTLYVYDKGLNLYTSIYPAPNGTPTYTNLLFRHATTDIAINSYGALLHKIVNESSTLDYFYWYRTLAMYDHLFNNGVGYTTDADKAPCAICGVVAYKDVFAVHSGMSDHVIPWFSIPVPYIFVFYPDRGIAINTSVIGIAVNVDYNLWSSNKIAAFDPTTGYIYIIDAPTLATTATTETATTTPATTVAETPTTTVTTTVTETFTTTLFHNVTTTATITTVTTVFSTTTVTTTQTIVNTSTVTTTTTETYTTTKTQTATTTATVTTTTTITATITTTETATTPTTTTPTNTTTITITTTETKTQTVTTTKAPYYSMTSSWLLLILLILIILAIAGTIRMASKSIATQRMEFVKKK